MESLSDYFDDIRRRLKEKSTIKNVGDDPVYYLIFPPDQILEVKSKIKTWKARLVKDGYKVEVLSLARIVNDILKNYDLRDVWLESEIENPFNFEDINSSLSDSLLHDNSLINRLKDFFNNIPDSKDTVVFITDIEALHPYLRVGTIEQSLNGCFTAPTIIFYPGTREGNLLRFLGVYPPDGNYRSVHIGG